MARFNSSAVRRPNAQLVWRSARHHGIVVNETGSLAVTSDGAQTADFA